MKPEQANATTRSDWLGGGGLLIVIPDRCKIYVLKHFQAARQSS